MKPYTIPIDATQMAKEHLRLLKMIIELQKVYKDGQYAVISVVTPENINHLPNSVKYLHQELGRRDIHLALNYFANWSNDTQAYTSFLPCS